MFCFRQSVIGCISILLCLLIAVFVFACEKKTYQSYDYYDEVEVCTSKACQETAKRWRRAMDLTADPCEDFYQYACGGFIAKHATNSDSIKSWDQVFNFRLSCDTMTDYVSNMLFEEHFEKEFLRHARYSFISCLFPNEIIDIDDILNFYRGLSIPPARVKACTTSVMRKFTWAIGAAFVRQDPEEENIGVRDMLNQVKLEFWKIVNDSSWMIDNFSLKETALKVENLIEIVGYDPSFLTDTEKPKDSSFVRERGPLAKSAAYYSSGNIFFVPLMIMYPPYFHLGLDVLEYGAIGAIIGHHFSHLIFAKRGFPDFIWRPYLNNYFELQDCLVDQYLDEFKRFLTIRKNESDRINGYYTFNENIADSVGLKAAFYAYKRLNGPKRKLVDFENYSTEQLFFVSNAHLMCSSETKQFTEYTIFNEVHSPFRYRVNLPMANFDEFARAWGCQLGSKMNPHKSWEKIFGISEMFCFSQSVLCCISILLCLLSAVFADSSAKDGEFNDKIEVCTSKECRDTADRWREAMDLTADPCEDFFQYACGGFIARNPVDNTTSSNPRDQITNVQSSLTFMNFKLIKMLRGESYEEELRKAREFFADCNSKENLPDNATLSTFEERLQNCTFLTIHNFRWPVGSSFIKQNPHEETVGAVRSMMDAIKFEFWEIVNDSKWMDEYSLYETAVKILNLTEIVGYHPAYLTENAEPTDWYVRLRSPFAHSATYYKFTNIMFVPLWTMSPPYFNLGLNVLNYGAIGTIIGHEFGHLFASYTVSLTGRSYFIWPVEVREIFYKKEDCIAAQYAEEFKKFMSFWKNESYAIDGIDTLDENLADYVGLKAAFYAYKRLNEPKRKLVDFENYSTEQLFFLSNAHLMCATETKEYIKYAIIHENHSPFWYRANLPMANFDEFAKAWRCPLGSKMNPLESWETFASISEMFCFRKDLLCCISIQLCLLAAVVADSSAEDEGYRQVCNSTECQDDRDSSPYDEEFNQNYDYNEEIEVCTSKECRATADRWHEAMDLTADPCEDFYQYACGGFIAKHATNSTTSNERRDQVLNIQLSDDNMNHNIKKMLLGDAYEEELRKARDEFVDCIFNRNLTDKVTLSVFKEITKHCTFTVMYMFEWELASAYIKQNPHEEAIRAVRKMMNAIKFKFWKIVLNSGWMDDTSLYETFKKVKKLALLPGYHSSFLTESQLPNVWILRLLSPFMHGATYFTFGNTIFVPLLTMSPPFFNLGLDVLDYGAIGVVIGHELAHMFATYDVDVNGNRIHIWPSFVKKLFDDKADCIRVQYLEAFEKFLSFWKDESHKIGNNNGNLDENVADFAGLKAAFYAYKRLKGPTRKLVDFENYSTEQLFFVSNAHLMCSSETMEFMKSTILQNKHSPFRFRANLPMANFDEFARAWGCTLGTKMNPHDNWEQKTFARKSEMFCFRQSALCCISILLCLLSAGVADSSPENGGYRQVCNSTECQDRDSSPEDGEFDQNYYSHDEIEVCASKECRATAARWHEAMDLTVDPCEDFFQYVCGKFISKHASNRTFSRSLRDQVFNAHSSIKFMNSNLIKTLLGESFKEELKQAREYFVDCIFNQNLPENMTSPIFKKILLNCTLITKSKFRWTLGSAIVKQDPHEETIGAVRSMMDAIKIEFWNIVNESEWMDEFSLSETALKILNLTEIVGYHPSYLTESREPRGDYNVRLRSPFTEKATYFAFINVVFVPLLIMSPPFFNLGLDVLDYGAIGATIGHEFAHLFTTHTVSVTGKTEIWPELVIKKFNEKGDCISAQYAEEFKNFMSFWKDETYAIDGTYSLSNNIADFTGLKAAFYAYKRLKGPKRKLVDFENYSTEQLFFISNAHLLCASETMVYTKLTILLEEHSPSRYRVNLPMANFDEFARAWGCTLGSKMNPHEKQSVLGCISILLCLLSAIIADSSAEDGEYRQVCNSTGCQDKADASPDDGEFNQNYEYYKKTKVCTSKECRATAARWREAMDLTADPCEDFYQYACGGFIAKHATNSTSNERLDPVLNIQLINDVMNSNIKKMLLGDSYEEELRKARDTLVDCIFNQNLPEKMTTSIFKEISERCTSTVMHQFMWDVFSAYIKQNPHEETIGEVRTMMDAIRFEFWKIVRNSGWMDKKSLHETFKKVTNLTFLPGYHPAYLTESEKPFGWLVMAQSPLTSSAAYYTYDNEIFVPLLIMSPPYFNLGLDVLDYGAIGVVIGHEFAHMFATYDVDVNGKFIYIWTSFVRHVFRAQEHCIRVQYLEEFQKFFWKDESFDINGNDTLAENLADLAGLKAAFYAYKRFSGQKQKLVHFEKYSTNQLFFISFAHLMCSSETMEYMKSTLLEQKHSPFRFRVNLPMANFNKFAKVWKCPLGTKMNPHENWEQKTFGISEMFCFRQSVLCCISIQLCLLSAGVADSSAEDGGYRQVCNSTECQDRDASPADGEFDQNYEFFDGIEVCTSKECRATAARWHEAMDLTADPCEDFFQYACGGFIRKYASDNRFHPISNVYSSKEAMNFNIKNLLLGDSYEDELRQARERFVDCIFNQYLPDKVTMPIFNEISRQCTSTVMEIFEWELASAYIKQDPHEENIEVVRNMLETIKFESWKIVKNSEWMDDTSLNETYKKVQKLALISGYHPWYLIGSEYQKDWLIRMQSPFNPRVSYVRIENEMFVPLLTMTPPYFNLGLDVLDYGAIGVVIGHEFAQMFATYNVNANGKHIEIWPLSVIRILFKKEDCIGAQFIEEFKKFLSFWGEEDETEHMNQ
ncbi:Hypothetical predicted protein [Cloeon dipterum]|uniref:Peptidase M13 C-terminal domain-containing protein n=1 Tax=Cloeon dipterum TaxID=197152 RepID=A0A8S1E011_9INSE|nr:Hypothetical predicted protein [Cloeon dipterum]